MSSGQITHAFPWQ